MEEGLAGRQTQGNKGPEVEKDAGGGGGVSPVRREGRVGSDGRKSNAPQKMYMSGFWDL